ncbi:IS3 family transposase, partial [Carboxydothermus pertinax]
KLKEKFSVEWLCELFGVSRSGYYKWLGRKDTLNRYQQQQANLDNLVKEIHSKHPSYGYRSVRAAILRSTGWKVSNISVLKSMKRLGIKSLARRKKYNFKKGSEHKIFPNILNRDFQSNKPFEKIATDITHLNYKGKKYYLACYLDLFNNEILEWNVQDKEDNYLILEPMERLLKNKRMNTDSPLVLHSDQGSQYSSLSFISLLEQYNVTQSMSRAGNPRDNAVMESF